ncbi:MAG: F0F1 ATP synthase subunit delta [Pseudomonadota bacterium]|jgi:F-type H+-transporting ATPase subunit delta|nr:F0F1 ATP synthase subunit delta [Pseudomonadota bacterium]MEC7464941.1 F0F1 ATP synthase subunit delta [Pseudomonadota bacterium]MEC7787520.1 F0F1 ATP synthase subunit delta [Pseudomonadota bacterium]MEC8108128.1 F0F1 ATP synthase subunit delta [Pseudomonadota bacterium]MEC8169284.1 F0F1 ATP synthase subunit delta [Pseudomonadota bacterium]|tara:strand:+ start:3507 stop:4043 length:537 start_codon:yes stop_codon:yes gene_type:complete
MAEYLTQSRPYAEAIFEIAEQDNSVDSWIKDLALISTSFQDNLIQALIDTPDISQREKAEKFVSIFEGEVSAKTINFLKTLGQANRLKILDNIILNFLELVAKKRNQKNVVVSSAFELESDQLEKIKLAMQKRLGADIIITSAVDKTLIGGMKISYEDQVIDLSLKNKLESLKTQLRN